MTPEIFEKYKEEAKKVGLELIEFIKETGKSFYKHDLCGHSNEYSPQDVKRSTSLHYRCSQCEKEKLYQEAEAVGVILLGPGSTTDYKIYKWKKCGHTNELYVKSVREKSIRCIDCMHERYEKEAFDAGLILMERTDHLKYRKYKWIKCGHINNYHIQAVKLKQVRCQECIENKYKEDAKLRGLEYLGDSSKKNYKRYRRIKCNHENDYQTGSVQKKPNHDIFCQKCFEENEKFATDIGLTIVSKTLNFSILKYKKDSCGHTFEYHVSKVKQKDVTCPKCLHIESQEELKKEKLIKLESSLEEQRLRKKELAEQSFKKMVELRAKLEIERENNKIKQREEFHDLKIVESGKDHEHKICKINSCCHINEYSIQQLKSSKKIQCYDCYIEKLKTKSLEKGFTFLGNKIYEGCFEYKCNRCEHQEYYDNRKIDNGTFKCEKCDSLKLMKQSLNIGMEFIGFSKDPAKGIYKNLTCEHVNEHLFISLDSACETIRCSQCEDFRWEKEAKKRGLTFIGNRKENGTCEYKWVECGHHQHYHPQMVRDNRIRCQQCLDIKLKLEASKVGLEILSFSREGHRIYKHTLCGHTNEYSLGSVRNSPSKNFPCPECTENKHRKEALEAGLELQGKATKQFRMYKRISCGHIDKFLISEVRKNKGREINCRICLEKKYNAEAFSQGLELIGPGRNYNYRLYRWLDCKHEKQYKTTSVRHKSLRCEDCLNNKYIAEAFSAGLQLLGPGKNSNHRNYKWVECGHIKDYHVYSVRKCEVSCQECINARYRKEALNNGFEIVPGVYKKSCRTYKCLNCGHIQKRSLSSMREGNVCCESCMVSGYSKSNNIYLLLIKSKWGEEWLKLGYARNPTERIKEFGLPDGTTVKELIIVPTLNGYDALKFEKALHLKFKKYRLNPTNMKEFHKGSGWTECYPLTFTNCLYEEVQKFNRIQ